jgi:hypothetical protein
MFTSRNPLPGLWVRSVVHPVHRIHLPRVQQQRGAIAGADGGTGAGHRPTAWTSSAAPPDSVPPRCCERVSKTYGALTARPAEVNAVAARGWAAATRTVCLPHRSFQVSDGEPNRHLRASPGAHVDGVAPRSARDCSAAVPELVDMQPSSSRSPACWLLVTLTLQAGRRNRRFHGQATERRFTT